jgi:hypothetical protein
LLFDGWFEVEFDELAGDESFSGKILLKRLRLMAYLTPTHVTTVKAPAANKVPAPRAAIKPTKNKIED